MASIPQIRSAERADMTRPVTTKIAGKFQVTVPVEIRDVFGLKEGDLLEWNFDPEKSSLVVLPKRAQLITPQIKRQVRELRARRARKSEHIEMGTKIV